MFLQSYFLFFFGIAESRFTSVTAKRRVVSGTNTRFNYIYYNIMNSIVLRQLDCFKFALMSVTAFI